MSYVGKFVSMIHQGVFLFCYFWNFRQTNAVCWAEKYPETKKTDTLINQSQEIRPQGLDLGRSMASNQAIANLRPQPRF